MQRRERETSKGTLMTLDMNSKVNIYKVIYRTRKETFIHGVKRKNTTYIFPVV